MICIYNLHVYHFGKELFEPLSVHYNYQGPCKLNAGRREITLAESKPCQSNATIPRSAPDLLFQCSFIILK